MKLRCDSQMHNNTASQNKRCITLLPAKKQMRNTASSKRTEGEKNEGGCGTHRD